MAEKKKRNPLVLLLKLIIVIVALGLGYKFGFGPLITAQKKQPSQLYVVNNGERGYDLSLGWRRLERKVHPNGYVHFQLYVGMKEKQKLTIAPESGDTPFKLSVPLEPDCILLVNLNQQGTYYEIEPERAQDQRIARLDLLRKEIATKQNPKTLLGIAADIQAIGTSTTLGNTNELFIDLTQYEPYFMEIDAFSELPEPGTRQKPLLTNEALDLTFANGEMRYLPAEPENLKATVKLDAPVSTTFGNVGTATLPAGTTLSIAAGNGTTTLSAFAQQVSKATYQDTVFAGSWTYRASHTNGRWDTTWSFNGSGKMKGSEYSLSMSFPTQGKPTTNLEKVEMMP